MKYVIDDNNNKYEGYSKEEFLALLEQAIEDGDLENIDADSAFVTKLKSITTGATFHVDYITQAQYNELEAQGRLDPNCKYLIRDDQTIADINAAITQLQAAVATIPSIKTQQFTAYYPALAPGQTKLGRLSVALPAAITNNNVIKVRCSSMEYAVKWGYVEEPRDAYSTHLWFTLSSDVEEESRPSGSLTVYIDYL